MADLPRPPIEEKVEDFVDWLGDNGEPVFGFIKRTLTDFYENLLDLFTWPDPYVFIVIVALAGWWVRKWSFAVFAAAGLLLVLSLDLWEESMQTLSLVIISTSIAVLIGVPIGILAARSNAVRAITMPVLDVMQTMPAFIYLIPAVSFFRIGVVPGIVATIVFAMPPCVRLTTLGIRQVDPEVVEAGHAFGTPPLRLLVSVQLPLARATIMAGVNQVIMLALSMVVIAGMIAAGGLGAIVFTGVQRLQIGKAFEAGLAVVVLAIILDRFTSTFATDKRVGRLARIRASRRARQARAEADRAEADPSTANDPAEAAPIGEPAMSGATDSPNGPTRSQQANEEGADPS